jgi:hypothetical protein
MAPMPASSPDTSGPTPWLHSHPAHWRPGTLDRDALHAAAAALRGEPGFEGAVRHFAAEWLDAFAANHALRAVMRNAPRYLLLIACLRLHHLRDPADPTSGITPGRVLAFYEAAGRPLVTAGASRVKVMLAHARAAGMLQPMPGLAGTRHVVLQPTPRLEQAMAAWVEAFLRGLSPMLPLPAPPAQMATLPGLVGELFTYRTSGVVHDRFNLNERVPPLRRLMDRERGYLVFLELMRELVLQAGGSASALATAQGLAQRTGLSRGTVRTMLLEGEHEGWWQRAASGPALLLQPAFVDHALLWMGLEFVWMQGLAVAAWHRLKPLTPSR